MICRILRVAMYNSDCWLRRDQLYKIFPNFKKVYKLGFLRVSRKAKLVNKTGMLYLYCVYPKITAEWMKDFLSERCNDKLVESELGRKYLYLYFEKSTCTWCLIFPAAVVLWIRSIQHSDHELMSISYHAIKICFNT